MAKNKTTQRDGILQDMVHEVNAFLKDSPEDRKAERVLVARLFAEVLHAKKSYRGYNYNYWRDHGFAAWMAAGRLDSTEDVYTYGPSGDQSRIHYY